MGGRPVTVQRGVFMKSFSDCGRMVSFRILSPLLRRLDRMADKMGWTRSESLRHLVDFGVSKFEEAEVLDDVE